MRERRFQTPRWHHITLASFILTAAFTALATPVIDATLNDGGASNTARGDVIQYEVQISNTGNTNALNVILTEGQDPNSTLTNVIEISPLAMDDAFTTPRNFNFTITRSMLFNNDRDPDNLFDDLNFSLVSQPGTGSVTVNVDGDFVFHAPSSTTASSTSFDYQISDPGGLTDTATVNITISGNIIFVDGDEPAGGDGSQTTPYNTLADAQANSNPNDFIYVRPSANPFNESIQLQENQTLIGAAAALELDGQVIIPASTLPADRPIIAPAIGQVPVVIDDVTGVSVKGLQLTATDSNAVNISNNGLDVSAVIEDNIIQSNSISTNVGVSVLLNSSTGSADISVLNNDISAPDNGISIFNFSFSPAQIMLDNNQIDTTTGSGSGIRVDSSSGAATRLAIINHTSIQSNSFAIELQGSSGSLYLTDFQGNVLNDSTNGFSANGVTFDRDPDTTAFDPVSIPSLTINTPQQGLSFQDVSGVLDIGMLDVTTSTGRAIFVDNFTPFNGASSQGLLFRATDGSVSASGGEALSLKTLSTNLNFSSFTSTNSTNTGISLTGVADTLTISGASISNATNSAISIAQSDMNVTLSGTVSQGNGNGKLLELSNIMGGSLDFSGANFTADGTASGISMLNSVQGVVTLGNVNIGQGTPLTNDGVTVSDNTGGSLTINNLNVNTSNGSGIQASSTAPSPFTLGVQGGTIAVDGLGRSALNLTNINTNINLADVTVNDVGLAGNGLAFNSITGSVAVTNSINIIPSTAGVARGISIEGGSASYNLATAGTITINQRGDEALFINGQPAGPINIGPLNVGSRNTGGMSVPAVLLNMGGTHGGITFNSVTIADSGDDGIRVLNSASPVSFGDVTINGAGLRGIDLDGNSGNVAFSRITAVGNSVNEGIRINNNTGSVAVNTALSLQNLSGSAIQIIGSSNSYTFQNAEIIDPAGHAVNISGFTGTMDYFGSIAHNLSTQSMIAIDGSSGSVGFRDISGNSLSTSSANGISMTNNNAGIFNFDTPVTTGTAATGIIINNDTGSAINFNALVTLGSGANNGLELNNNDSTTFTRLIGGLDIDTTSGTGIFADGTGSAGMLAIIGSTTIDSTSGSLFELRNVIVGADGIDLGDTIASTASGLSTAFTDGLTGSGALNISNFTSNGTTNFNDAFRITNNNVPITLNTLTINSSSGNGLVLDNTANTIQISSGTLANIVNNAVTISGGNQNISLGTSITNSAGRLIDINGRTGGTVTLSGILQDNGGQGISLTNNNGQIDFSGSVTLNDTSAEAVTSNTTNGGFQLHFNQLSIDNSTSNSNGVRFTGAGQLDISNGSINSGSGIAFDASDVDLNVSLSRIDSNGASFTPLSLTNASGNFVVTGDGNGSGGTLSNSGNQAISLNNVGTVSLRQMTLSGSTHAAIEGQDVDNFSMDDMNITNSGSATGDQSVHISSLARPVNFSSNNSNFLSNNNGAHLYFNNQATGSSTYNITGGSINDAMNYGIHLLTGSDAIATLNITNTSFQTNQLAHVFADSQGSSQLTLNADNVSFSSSAARGFDLYAKGDSQLNYTIQNSPNLLNTGTGVAVNLRTSETSTNLARLQGTITNNSWQDWDYGVMFDYDGSANARVNIDGNQGSNLNGSNVIVAPPVPAISPNNNISIIVQNNTFTPNSSLFLIDINASNNAQICTQIQSNTFSLVDGNGIQLENSGNGSVHNVFASSAPSIEDFLINNNTGVTVGDLDFQGTLVQQATSCP